MEANGSQWQHWWWKKIAYVIHPQRFSRGYMAQYFVHHWKLSSGVFNEVVNEIYGYSNSLSRFLWGKIYSLAQNKNNLILHKTPPDYFTSTAAYPDEIFRSGVCHLA